MPIEFKAGYENGVLKPVKPLPLQEHQRVEETIQTGQSLARQTSGLVPWQSDADSLERIAADPEFGLLESS